MTQVVMRQAGGLRSGLMFYADGNTRDGMVDMISGSPGLVMGSGDTVMDSLTRGWKFENDDDAGIYFDSPALAHFDASKGLSMWFGGSVDDTYYWGGVQVSAAPGQYPARFGVFENGFLKFEMRQGGIPSARFIGHELEVNANQQLLVTWKQGGDTRFYKNGNLLGVDSTANTGAIDPVYGAISLGNQNSLERIGGGPMTMTWGGAIWNRELDAEEVGLLARDPLALRRLCWRKKVITNY